MKFITKGQLIDYYNEGSDGEFKTMVRNWLHAHVGMKDSELIHIEPYHRVMKKMSNHSQLLRLKEWGFPQGFQAGEYIYSPKVGTLQLRFIEDKVHQCIDKYGFNIAIILTGNEDTKGNVWTLATKEQIEEVHRLWSEGIEHSKRYRKGQACLVSFKATEWTLKFADGNGLFYSIGNEGIPIHYLYHIPLTEKTVERLNTLHTEISI